MSNENLDALLETLDWAPESQMRSLNQVFEYTVGKTQGSIGWYYKSAKSKKQGAQRLRIIAILFGAIGTIFPVIGTVADVNPAYATIILSISATAIGIDTFFGYSSSWIRFITTAMKLEARLVVFRFAWHQALIANEGDDPSPDQVKELVASCATMLNEVQSMVEEETQMWVQEFKQSLRSYGEKISEQRQALATGAITVQVTNGNHTDDGWELRIDDRNPLHYTGITAAISNLVPNMYKVTVEGLIEGMPRRTEAVVPVAAGEIVKISLTLE